MREIERLIVDRYDGQLPDTDDADIFLDQVACCLLRMRKGKVLRATCQDLFDRLAVWCEGWAPEVSLKLCWDVAKNVHRRPRTDDADTCARLLRVSYVERTRLRMTTIGAFDADKRERKRLYKARKRARDRERAAKKRLERGVIPRHQYLAMSLSAMKPWDEEGISRRTWERRRRLLLGTDKASRKRDASVSPSNTIYLLGDELATGVLSFPGAPDCKASYFRRATGFEVV